MAIAVTTYLDRQSKTAFTSNRFQGFRHRMHKKLTTYMKLRSGKEVLYKNSIERKAKEVNLRENRSQTARQQRDRKRRKRKEKRRKFASE